MENLLNMNKNLSWTFLVLLIVYGCTKDYILQPISLKATFQSSEPNLFTSLDGTTYLSFISTDLSSEESKLYFSTLDLDNLKWNKPSLINSSADWFVNWADFPRITANNLNGLSVHYLQKSGEDTYSYDIKVMNSSDGGANWNKPLKLHTDNTKTEHGFVSTINYNNDFLSTYLDGRQNELAKHDKGIKPQMTLRSTSYNVNGEILMDKLIDDRVCDCCQTDLGITKSNIPITVYRDRSENETRDIYYSFFKDSNWSIPAVVNNDKWIISGCPVNGPAISTFKNSSSVVWYTEEEGESKLKIAFSENIINGFDDPILINANDPLGRVDIEMISETSSLISYMDIVDEKAYIKVQKINSITGNNKFIIIEEISNTRASGFPKINIIDNDKTIITWTDAQNKYNVKTMLLNNSYFD
ncbi:MAG: Uncharacterised protein [Flavobacteriaceae bacterium]|nr:MAG: Uncharacterised protein [Flavobacteriaceae bacterium]